MRAEVRSEAGPDLPQEAASWSSATATCDLYQKDHRGFYSGTDRRDDGEKRELDGKRITL